MSDIRVIETKPNPHAPTITYPDGKSNPKEDDPNGGEFAFAAAKAELDVLREQADEHRHERERMKRIEGMLSELLDLVKAGKA